MQERKTYTRREWLEKFFFGAAGAFFGKKVLDSVVTKKIERGDGTKHASMAAEQDADAAEAQEADRLEQELEKMFQEILRAGREETDLKDLNHLREDTLALIEGYKSRIRAFKNASRRETLGRRLLYLSFEALAALCTVPTPTPEDYPSQNPGQQILKTLLPFSSIKGDTTNEGLKSAGAYVLDIKTFPEGQYVVAVRTAAVKHGGNKIYFFPPQSKEQMNFGEFPDGGSYLEVDCENKFPDNERSHLSIGPGAKIVFSDIAETLDVTTPAIVEKFLNLPSVPPPR